MFFVRFQGKYLLFCEIAVKIKKHVNRDSHMASLPITQSFSLEEVCWLVLAFSQRKLLDILDYFEYSDTNISNLFFYEKMASSMRKQNERENNIHLNK